MKNRRRVIGIVVATLLAVAGVTALVTYVQSAKDSAVAKEALVSVYMVDKLISKGADAATIKASVSIEQVPARLKQPGAVNDLAAVGERVAGSDLQPGDQLIAARLVAKTDSAVPADKVQVSATLEPERAVGGVLKTGDTVGVYLSFDPFQLDEAGQASAAQDSTSSSTSTTAQKHTPNTTRLEFQHVLVTNVQVADEQTQTVDGKDQAKLTTGTHYVVTLALTPEQSERFVFATEFGHVWLSSEAATVSDDGTRLVTLGNVFKVVQ
jgi:pilus assembly protein CpaB